MENHLDKLLYLVVGVIYLFLNNAKSRHAEKQTVADEAPESQPATEAHADWLNTWGSEVQETPVVKKPLLQTTTTKRPLLSAHNTTTHPAAQQPLGKKMDHRLRRYGSWQKAIIMGELLQPRS
jgi:hypothetical protein